MRPPGEDPETGEPIAAPKIYEPVETPQVNGVTANSSVGAQREQSPVRIPASIIVASRHHTARRRCSSTPPP
eukprot:7378910-Prymnesium_polylepis.3